ncbi:hypothetical protein [Microcoleus sp.]|uniref:hypothetical protein n=1 Tax=Microcoleus sp. TaxID=44472 RepID=UPI00403E8315
MYVYFKVELDQYHQFNEFDLTVLTNAQLSALSKKKAFDGILILAHEGSPDIQICDELEPWVQNLCFDSIPTMLADQPHEILYFSRPGFIQLEPKGESVRFSGDLIPTVQLPILSLAPALYDCGNRFLKWVSKVKEGDDSYLSNLNYIAEYRQPALNALKGADIALPSAD